MDTQLSEEPEYSSVDTDSLGMVVIDEIRLPSREPLIDIAGGSGTYATLGSRLFCPLPHCRRVGCLVVSGHDFPDAVLDKLTNWSIHLQLVIRKDKKSTRGLLEYQDDTFGVKTFRYTTEPLRPLPKDFNFGVLMTSQAFHFLATPEEIREQVPELMKLRAHYHIKRRPLIVWEPFPAACVPQNRQAFLEACKLVDIFPPNHLEIAALYGDGSTSTNFQPEKLEAYAREFCTATGVEGKYVVVVVVRAGEQGSLTIQSMASNLWLPAYYEAGATEVVDATGGGNAFLGGFMRGWKISQDIKEASVYGHVAASFAIEQIGLPTCVVSDGEETWNGVKVMKRLAKNKARLSLQRQLGGKMTISLHVE